MFLTIMEKYINKHDSSINFHIYIIKYYMCIK